MNPKPHIRRRLHVPSSSSAQTTEYDAWLYGKGWNDSAFCLPWADVYGVKRFAVLSPAYGGDVLTCSFGDGWWNETFGVFITGVTHWHLADESKQDYWVDPAQWPESGEIALDFAAQRWHWLHIDGPLDFIYEPDYE